MACVLMPPEIFLAGLNRMPQCHIQIKLISKDIIVEAVDTGCAMLTAAQCYRTRLYNCDAAKFVRAQMVSTIHNGVQ